MKLPPALVLGPPALLLAACMAVQVNGQTTAPSTVDVRAAMLGQVNPATLTIWDVGNKAMSDTGGIDASLMNEADWARLSKAAKLLDESAKQMASADVIVSAAPGNMPEGENAGASMAEIQTYIDANPEGFRAAARELETFAAQLSSAATARDAGRAGDLVANLDTVCESCHSPYWYPQ